MNCYNCETELDECATVCPICKHDQYMLDMFGERILISDYLEPLEKHANSDIVDDKEEV